MSAGYVAGAIDYVNLPLLQCTEVAAEQIPVRIAQADERVVAGRRCPRQQKIVGGDDGATKTIHRVTGGINVVTQVNTELCNETRVEEVSQSRCQRFFAQSCDI